MQNDDNDSETPMGATPPEGLGHDPLEWLQEDDGDAVADALHEEPSAEATESPSIPEPEPEVAQQTEAASPAEQSPEVDADQNPPKATMENSSQGMGNQSLTIDNHKAIIRLPEKLSVQIVEPLHTEWKTLFYDLPQSLEIDAGDVKDVDAAGMQLLYILVQQMSFKGSDVVVLNVHHNLQRYVKVAGLEEFFTQFVHAA